MTQNHSQSKLSEIPLPPEAGQERGLSFVSFVRADGSNDLLLRSGSEMRPVQTIGYAHYIVLDDPSGLQMEVQRLQVAKIAPLQSAQILLFDRIEQTAVNQQIVSIRFKLEAKPGIDQPLQEGKLAAMFLERGYMLGYRSQSEGQGAVIRDLRPDQDLIQFPFDGGILYASRTTPSAEFSKGSRISLRPGTLSSPETNSNEEPWLWLESMYPNSEPKELENLKALLGKDYETFSRVRQAFVEEWSTGGDYPVKVVPPGVEIDSVKGYFTTQKWIAGCTPHEMEARLGLSEGYLKEGAHIYKLTIDREHSFNIRGYSNVLPVDKMPDPRFIPGSGVGQFELLEQVKARRIAILKYDEPWKQTAYTS